MFNLLCKSIGNRRWSLLWVMLSLALALGLTLFVERVREGVRVGFGQSVGGVDLLVGAPTGDVQLLLHTVFNLGEPARGIRLSEIEPVLTRAGATWQVPLALGDFHRGFPVVATTPDYFDHRLGAQGLPLRYAEGGAFNEPYEVVLGAQVAKELGYSLGQSLVVSHGQTAGFAETHEAFPFTVVGILEPSGTPQDRSLFLALADFNRVHDLPSQGPRTEVSAVLVGAPSPFALFGIQRAVVDAGYGAVLPGVALSRFWALFGSAEQALRILSLALLCGALLTLAAQVAAQHERRKREMALFRCLGAPRRWVVGFMLFEVWTVLTVAMCLAVLALSLASASLGQWLANQNGIVLEHFGFGAFEASVIGLSYAVSGIIASLAAILAYRGASPLQEIEKL